MNLTLGIGSIFGLMLGLLTGGLVLPPLPHAFFEMGEATTSGFSVLGDIDSLGGYTENGLGVFYRGSRVPGADPTTFTVIDAYYAKDATNVYFNLEPISLTSTTHILSGADPRTLACVPPLRAWA